MMDRVTDFSVSFIPNNFILSVVIIGNNTIGVGFNNREIIIMTQPSVGFFQINIDANPTVRIVIW